VIEKFCLTLQSHIISDSVELFSYNLLQHYEENEYVLLMEVDGNIVGTGSLLVNEIGRMFILPLYQGLGYGTSLLNELEKYAFENGYTSVTLDASLPAYGLYEKRGYIPIEYNKITTPEGQVLCYNKMKKTNSSSSGRKVKTGNSDVIELNACPHEKGK